MTTATETPRQPNVPQSSYLDDLPERKIPWLERTLGPDNYRLLVGIVHNPLSVLGISLIIFYLVLAWLAPFIIPSTNKREPFMTPRDGYGPVPLAPGAEWKTRPPKEPFWFSIVGKEEWTHIFGTTSGQYDLFYGVVWGARTALKVGLTVESFTLIIGILVGALSAFYGGKLDNVLMRITDIFMAFPYLLAALTLSAILTPVIGKGIWPPLIAMIAFGWMGYARIIRGDILSVRERDYIMAARVIGVKDRRIILKHVIPNAIYPTLILGLDEYRRRCDFLCCLELPWYRHRGRLCGLGPDDRLCPQLDSIPGNILVDCAFPCARPDFLHPRVEPGWRCAARYHGSSNAPRTLDSLTYPVNFITRN